VYLRTRLRILILVTLLPVATIGAVGTWLLVQREIEAVQAGTWERTRAMTTAMDAEFRTSMAALALLATSPALRAGDLEGFRPEAERALQTQDVKWLTVFVSDAHSGRMLLDVRVPPGRPLPAAADPATVMQAAASGRPMVSQLVADDLLQRKRFSVRVPAVFSERPVDYVLSAAIDPQRLERLVAEQRFPRDWAVAILDGREQFVVRRPAINDDGIISESLRRALRAPAHGWTQGVLKDGREVYRTVQRSSVADWAVSVAIPKSHVEQSLHYVQLLWVAFGVALAVCLWLAWWLAKGVGRPITALADAAPALGRGQALVLHDAGSIEEVRQLYEALQQASARLRERDADRAAAEQMLRAAGRAKDEFLAMLGHELRNPLSSLANAAELLRHAPERPELVPRVAALLGRQVQQMTRLVDDLLEVGRVTAGKITLARRPLDLAEAVRLAAATLEASGRLGAHRVAFDLQPAWVEADGTRLEQIATNLMDNALKYTPAGGRIDVSVKRDGADALLQIADDGQGMPPELLRSAFDLFVQGDRSLSREAGGLGIGLTLAQRLAQLHGGQITAESAGQGLGSTFTVRLPAIEPPPDAAAGGELQAPPRACTVLVIEDNADAAESLVMLLELLGHRPEWADRGGRGIERATALQPELVLVDVGLPDMDGYEVARRLRAQPETRSLRLVALTGYGTPEDRPRALAAGFDDHLPKPIGLPELETLLAGC
jgi:signal transduction histidine kinase/CheY-like chemotaxis protein